MKQLHANLILVCVFLCLALFTVTQNWKLSDYSNMITDLTNKLKNSETKLSEAEERTFALGENLWNKKHTYDIKFLIGNDTEHEFYAHKYILTANSPYFEILFSKNTTNVISYTDIHKKQFNSVLELLYFGKFQSNVSLSSLLNVLKYMDKYMILEKYTNYTDSYFSNLFNNTTSTNEELFDVDLVSSIYDVSLDNKLTQLRSEIMKIVYTSWRKYNTFDKSDIVNHPKLFYDYIRFLNC